MPEREGAVSDQPVLLRLSHDANELLVDAMQSSHPDYAPVESKFKEAMRNPALARTLLREGRTIYIPETTVGDSVSGIVYGRSVTQAIVDTLADKDSDIPPHITVESLEANVCIPVEVDGQDAYPINRLAMLGKVHGRMAADANPQKSSEGFEKIFETLDDLGIKY